MGTLTIRKLDDDVLEHVKEEAKKHHRSTEAEVRSLLEDFTAGLIVRHDVEHTNFYDRLRAFMDQEGIDGFTEAEFPTPDRSGDAERPPLTFDAS